MLNEDETEKRTTKHFNAPAYVELGCAHRGTAANPVLLPAVVAAGEGPGACHDPCCEELVLK